MDSQIIEKTGLHLMALCNLLRAAGLLLTSAAARRRVTGELFALRLSIAPGTGLRLLVMF